MSSDNLNMYNILCSDDTVGRPFDCLNYSYTGAYNSIITYTSYSGAYMTGSYKGPTCFPQNCTDTNILNCPVYMCENSTTCSSNPSTFCKDRSKYCDDSNMDTLMENLDNKNCTLLKNRNFLVGDIKDIGNAYALRTGGRTNYKVKIDYLYSSVLGTYLGSKTTYSEMFNQTRQFPETPFLYQNPNTVIKALEIKSESGKILRLSGVYYCEAKNITKPTELRAYNEEFSPNFRDIAEDKRKDIYGKQSGSKIGRSSIDGQLTDGITQLIKGSFADSCLVGISYRYANANSVGISPVTGIMCAFKRFYKLDSPIEYIGFEETGGNVVKVGYKPFGNYVGTEVGNGEFISQIEVCSSDFLDTQLSIGAWKILKIMFADNPVLGAQAIGLYGAALAVITAMLPILTPILIWILVPLSIAAAFDSGVRITTEIIGGSVGLKGFSRVVSVRYNINDRLYDNWLKKVTPLHCCQLVSEEQYEKDNIEAYYCNDVLQFQVKNDFPNAYPNQSCVNVLKGHCNTYSSTGYHIEEEVCKMACGITKEGYVVDCDTGINDYCTSDEFKEVENGKTYYGIMKRYKDDICGCAFNEIPEGTNTFDKSFGTGVLNSYVSSFELLLNKNLKIADQSSPPKQLRPIILRNGKIRKECTLGSCAQTSYKYNSMKQTIDKNLCSDQEQCFGFGYQIPLTIDNDTNIDCQRTINPPYSCVIDESTKNQINPKITMIPNPDNFEYCKTIIDNPPEKITSTPTPCKVSQTDWTPSVKTTEQQKRVQSQCVLRKDKDGVTKKMLKQKRRIISPSIPLNDPSLCPPIEYDSKGNIVYTKDQSGELVPKRINMDRWISCPKTIERFNFQTTGEPETATTNKPKSTLVLDMFILIITLVIIVLFIAIIKKRLKT
jgi:hypothetical protein